MSPTHADLLRRIEAFSLDGPDPPALPFASRLAREHGWSRKYAGRVIGEYKRYVFLAVTTGHPVCPSEDVDAAWHLHLTYTRSYWKHFCNEVLGQPLHHDPTKGGANEDAKHHAMYDTTRAAYREAFSEEPPSDVWPAAEVRFGPDLQQRMVNTARNWVVPKAALQRVAGGLAVAVLAAVLIPGCEGDGLNPFNLKGVEFLVFLIPAMLGAAILGRVLRSLLRAPGPMANDETRAFNWQETAYIVGGNDRLASTAVARLFERKVLKVSEDRLFLERVGKKPDKLTAVENEVWQLLPLKNKPAELKALTRAVKTVYADEARRLHEDGYALSFGRDVAIGWLAMIPLLLVVLAFALPRLVIGWNNNKPVGFLIATILVGGFLGMSIAAGGRRTTTRRADAILARMKRTHDALRKGKGLGADHAALAVALFGTAVLSGTALHSLGLWYPRLTNESSTGCSSGCGTSSSSGSDGGGGDSGGGGCGGCGGGCGGGGGD